MVSPPGQLALGG